MVEKPEDRIQWNTLFAHPYLLSYSWDPHEELHRSPIRALEPTTTTTPTPVTQPPVVPEVELADTLHKKMQQLQALQRELDQKLGRSSTTPVQQQHTSHNSNNDGEKEKEKEKERERRYIDYEDDDIDDGPVVDEKDEEEEREENELVKLRMKLKSLQQERENAMLEVAALRSQELALKRELNASGFLWEGMLER